MSQRFVQVAFWLYDQPRRAAAARTVLQQPAFRRAAHLACLWLAYVAGAAAGAMSWIHIGIMSLLGPIVVVGLIAAIALVWPVPLP